MVVAVCLSGAGALVFLALVVSLRSDRRPGRRSGNPLARTWHHIERSVRTSVAATKQDDRGGAYGTRIIGDSSIAELREAAARLTRPDYFPLVDDRSPAQRVVDHLRAIELTTHEAYDITHLAAARAGHSAVAMMIPKVLANEATGATRGDDGREGDAEALREQLSAGDEKLRAAIGDVPVTKRPRIRKAPAKQSPSRKNTSVKKSASKQPAKKRVV